MLNAKKNAKIIGVILILSGLFDFLKGIKVLTDFLNNGSSLIPEDLLALFMLVLSPLTALVIGYGLSISKLWAVYGMGVLSLVQIVSLVWASSGARITTGNLVVVGIYILLFIWFYSNKKYFVK